jgi:hypothetical protein
MKETIENALTPLERALFRRDVDEVAAELNEIWGDVMGGVARRFSGGLRRVVEEIEACLALCRRSIEERRALESRFAALNESLAASASPAEREELMIEFLALITPPERLAGDRAAFRRYMGLDCVAERYQRALEVKYRREEILAKTIGALASRVIVAVLREPEPDSGEVRPENDAAPRKPREERALARVNALLRDIAIEPLLLGQVRDAKRWQNRVAAFHAIGQLAASLPPAGRSRLLSAETSNFLIRCCLDADENVWIQRGALELLCDIAPKEALRVLERRILADGAGRKDDMFVRAHAVFLLPRVAPEARSVELLARLVRRPEPSEYVRMQVVRTLAGGRTYEAERLLLELVRGEGDRRDRSPRVRAEAATEWRKKAERDPAKEEIAARVLAWLIRRDDALLVRRVAFEEAAALAAHRQRRTRKYKIDRLDHILLEAIDEVCRADPDIGVRRLAEEAREAIIVRNLPAFAWVEGRIAQPLAALDEHSDLRLPRRDVTLPEEILGRILAWFTRDDFGIVIDRRGSELVFRKGDRIRRRLWRILHEFRNLDTAKRQAFCHTTGRVFRGEVRIHPGMLAELMETKVPGERLWNEAEQSWRRFLPLVDDYLSLFSWLPWRRQRTARIYSSQGVTEIRDTNGFFQGLRRYLKMSWRYAFLAGLRNAHERNKVFSDPSKFVEIMREEYGIETRFTPAEYQFDGVSYALEDDSLAEHFKHGLPPAREGAPAAAGALAAAADGSDTALDIGGAAPAPGDPERTPLDGEAETPSEGAEAPATPAEAPAFAAEDDSIDALLKPLGAESGSAAALLLETSAAGVSDGGSESFAASGTGGRAATGATGDDTADEVPADLGAPVPGGGRAAAGAPDETLSEIAYEAAPARTGLPGGESAAGLASRPGGSRSGPRSQEPGLGDDTADEGPPPLDTSTASAAERPDSAGEISSRALRSGGGGDETPAAPDETSDEPPPAPAGGGGTPADDTADEVVPAADETADEPAPAPDETADEPAPTPGDTAADELAPAAGDTARDLECPPP